MLLCALCVRNCGGSEGDNRPSLNFGTLSLSNGRAGFLRGGLQIRVIRVIRGQRLDLCGSVSSWFNQAAWPDGKRESEGESVSEAKGEGLRRRGFRL